MEIKVTRPAVAAMRAAVIVALCSSLALTACGRKGFPKPPPAETKKEQPAS